MEKRDALFIGGKWVASASGKTIDVINPYTEEVMGTVPEACETDIDAAVAAAQKALASGWWRQTTPDERADMLAAIGAGIMGRAREIADLITAEMGCPASFSLAGQALAAGMLLNIFADIVRSFPFQELRQGVIGPNLVVKQPVGVSAAIIPWNAPLFAACIKLGAAIGAGSPVVLKPAPEAPLDAFVLAEVCEAVGLPAGMLNVVPAGREIGEYLVRHPGIDKVAFTGSTAAGRRIGAICGELLKRCTLELGGKSAAIVLEDANLEETISLLLPNAIMNNGQACLAQTRILAPRSRYDEINRALAAAVSAMTVGNPADPSVQVGPLVSESQRQRVEGYLAKGRKEGAAVLCGGGRPREQKRGWFIEPTLFSNVDNSMTIAREEIFGPVLVTIPFEDQDDAIRIANDSEYGLSGSVWTRDITRGIEVAKGVRTGTYGVNAVATMDIKAPFGGFKASGLGRELGPEGVDAFLETQTIVLPVGYVPGAPH